MGRHADAADSAGIDNPFGVRGSSEQMAGSFDIGFVKFIRIPGPEPVIGGDVKDLAATLSGTLERSGVPKIARDAFDIELANLTGRPAERPDVIASLDQQASDMPTKESAGSSD
jgi:hypothetical protein